MDVKEYREPNVIILAIVNHSLRSLFSLENYFPRCSKVLFRG